MRRVYRFQLSVAALSTSSLKCRWLAALAWILATHTPNSPTMTPPPIVPNTATTSGETLMDFTLPSWLETVFILLTSAAMGAAFVWGVMWVFYRFPPHGGRRG